MQSFEPTAQQRAVIEHRGSHLLVLAGPGTGKTETLARRFASLAVDDGVDPSAILVLTFSRRAAEQMLERVVLRLRERTGKELAVSELFVRTFHSFCARLLDGDGPRFRERNLLTPVKERLLWKRVAARTPLRSFDEDVRTSPAFAADALNLIAQLKGYGLSPADLARAGESDVRLADIAALYRALDEDRRRLELSDFRDLVQDALEELAKPQSPAARWLRERGGFAHILVDEFQDSDKLQLRLLEVLAGPARLRKPPAPEICFVGDFNQSIYRFRGASPENIGIARQVFRCEQLTLSTNRRSAQAILDVANRTPKMDPASLTQAENLALAGSVRLLRTASPDAEVAQVRSTVAQMLLEGTAAREIAILLRVSEPYTSAIVSELDQAGIPVAARPAAGFLEDAAVSAVLATLRTLADPSDEALWTRLLTNPLVGYRAISVRMAFDRARRDGERSPLRALQALPPEGIRPFAEFLAAWRRVERIASTAGIASVVVAAARELDVLRAIRDDSSPPGWDARSSPLRLDALLEAAQDLESSARALGDGRIEAARFVADIEEIAGLLDDPAQVPPPEAEGVRVMSIHAAKGLEFDAVIVPQAIDGVLPQRGRGHALLSLSSERALRRLAPSLFAGDDEAFTEECSLWYVALTRARRHVVVSAARADRDDIELPLSPFASPLGAGEAAHPLPLLQPSEAWPADGARQIQARSALTYDVDHLSPSLVETFLTCPRRFFYQEVLRLEPERDPETTLMGTMLHVALAQFHDAHRDFTVTTVPAELQARWRADLTASMNDAVESVARRHGLPVESNFIRYLRAIGHQYMDKYLRWLVVESGAAPFEVLACEIRLEAQIGGVRFRGRADRVDRLAGGGLAIRDYKSGKARPATVTTIRDVLERRGRGETVAGTLPRGLNVQTLLYIPGAQAAFGERVVRVEYLYFRGADKRPQEIATDSVLIARSDAEIRADALTDGEVERAQIEIAAAVARDLAAGRLTAFATASDGETCRFCDFVSACPGALAVAP
ncbi:MAG: ATP-dependent helicase [Candidatus Eremiobacteraeota bacterium]|nr:ATP-dependent helicase [Candidatus Eremiobacteraeota bacterium]